MITDYTINTLKCTKTEHITDVTTPTFTPSLTPSFTPADVKLRLSKLPMDKAIPVWSLTSAEWKAATDYVATPLADIWNNIAEEGKLPDKWVDLQTVWIPKPGKDSGYIANKRPINLADPMCKAYLSHLQHLASKNQAPYWKPTIKSRSTV